MSQALSHSPKPLPAKTLREAVPGYTIMTIANSAEYSALSFLENRTENSNIFIIVQTHNGFSQVIRQTPNFADKTMQSNFPQSAHLNRSLHIIRYMYIVQNEKTRDRDYFYPSSLFDK